MCQQVALTAPHVALADDPLDIARDRPEPGFEKIPKLTRVRLHRQMPDLFQTSASSEHCLEMEAVACIKCSSLMPTTRQVLARSLTRVHIFSIAEQNFLLFVQESAPSMPARRPSLPGAAPDATALPGVEADIGIAAGSGQTAASSILQQQEASVKQQQAAAAYSDHQPSAANNRQQGSNRKQAATAMGRIRPDSNTPTTT